jgi:hypothetical protein
MLIVEVGTVRLCAHDPVRFVIEQQRDARVLRRITGRAERAQFLADLRHFLAALRERVVRCMQSRVHLFLRIRTLAPAEIRDQFRTVREGFPCPEPHDAGLRHRVPRRPVHGPRLLLHDPHAAVADTAIEVVTERRDVGMPCSCPAMLVGLPERQHLRARHRVTVPGGDIETVTRKRVVIERGEETHEVVQQIAPRGMCANQFGLQRVEACHLVGLKAAKVEHVRRIEIGGRALR